MFPTFEASHLVLLIADFWWHLLPLGNVAILMKSNAAASLCRGMGSTDFLGCHEISPCPDRLIK